MLTDKGFQRREVARKIGETLMRANIVNDHDAAMKRTAIFDGPEDARVKSYSKAFDFYGLSSFSP